MNLYDVLRLIIAKMPLPEVQAADCIAVIDEAERMNMLGTSAKRMEVQVHACQYAWNSNVCSLCGRGRDE